MVNCGNIRPFGITADGQMVEQIRLSNGLLHCEILTLGATLRSLEVPNRAGDMVDVVLGYDRPEAYMGYGGYMGATVGRYANRIARGWFMLNGEVYTLNTNMGGHHLHGGQRGFSHRVWQVDACSENAVTFRLNSPHMEEGYPGNMTVTVQYRLEGSSLAICYGAISDRDTVCSLTNHSYFNLAGHNSGPVMAQQVQLYSQCYTPTNEENIPLGIREPVENTPMDLRVPGPIDTPQRRVYAPLLRCGGFDHSYVIDGPMGTLRPAARAYSPATGIGMEVETTMPGVQFYTGNFIYPKTVGKGGCIYGPWHGFCLETQFFPDAPNQPDFPSPVLKAGEKYDHTTVFRFTNAIV